MNKVAVVVQRCHDDIVGGSESLAWHYAGLLSNTYEVDLLTTTAIETGVWANTLPAGSETKNGVRILRFKVTTGRSQYWGELHQRLPDAFYPFTPPAPAGVPLPEVRWSIALQEDFIRHQGPYSEPLLMFIRENWRAYRALIFVTYLYPTTYFGLQQVSPGHALYAPTLHDELPAYLPVYKHAARRAGELIWLTAGEQRVGRKLWGELPGRIVSMAIDTELRQSQPVTAPYLLYCGRVDPNKGCRDLFENFIAFKQTHPGDLRLVITGKDDIPVPNHEDIEFRGFVSAEEKFRLMAGAMLFVNPSPNESFSIVTLEAMAQHTPILANSASTVLADHVEDSGAGRTYNDYQSFAQALQELASDKAARKRMGEMGREYVLSRYQKETIKKALIDAVESSRGET